MKLDVYDFCDTCIKGKQVQKCLASEETGVNLWHRCLGHLGIHRHVELEKPCERSPSNEPR